MYRVVVFLFVEEKVVAINFLQFLFTAVVAVFLVPGAPSIPALITLYIDSRVL
jgi:hypothetical protein